MKKLMMDALSDYSSDKIRQALERYCQTIAEKLPNTVATADFWKAVENRLILQRELTIRGKCGDLSIPLPEDRLPLLTIEHN